MVDETSHQFKKKSVQALQNNVLQSALSNLKNGFVKKRAHAIQQLPQFDAMRDEAVEIKNHTLQHLDYYLEKFEEQAIANGAEIHWAEDANSACKIAMQICKRANAKTILKSKSMVAEEIGLNAALEEANFKVIETDLGEYIIQLRQETPTHIVVPAIHLSENQIAKDFYHHHQHLNPERELHDASDLIKEARDELREKFLTADIGMTGANCLIAENGSLMIVSNEGNVDLILNCCKVNIAIVSIDKIVPTIFDAMNILRLLPRSATGQAITSYVTFIARENVGKERHIILVDNGRSKLLGSGFQDMLRCIRCGACLNHCPVYAAVGGQTYDTTYPGPMGAVLSPSLFGIKHTKDLPNASTFCGKCEAVCPMKIPLPTMMRYYREQEFQNKLSSKTSRVALKIWIQFAKNPFLYHLMMRMVAIVLHLLGYRKGKLSYLPFATEWTKHRDLPIPSRKTFHDMWHKMQKQK